jgi:hypothetical protein
MDTCNYKTSMPLELMAGGLNMVAKQIILKQLERKEA